MSLVPSDEELFEDRPRTPEAIIEHGHAILRILKGHGFELTYDLDLDDAERLWGSHLWRFDLGLVARAVHQYDLEMKEIERQNPTRKPDRKIPTEGELEVFILHWLRSVQNEERQQQDVPTMRTDRECPKCPDVCALCETNGWADPDGGGLFSPCPRCRPDAARLWSEGHGTKEHRRRGGCPACQPVFNWKRESSPGPRRARASAKSTA